MFSQATFNPSVGHSPRSLVKDFKIQIYMFQNQPKKHFIICFDYHLHTLYVFKINQNHVHQLHIRTPRSVPRDGYPAAWLTSTSIVGQQQSYILLGCFGFEQKNKLFCIETKSIFTPTLMGKKTEFRTKKYVLNKA